MTLRQLYRDSPDPHRPRVSSPGRVLILALTFALTLSGCSFGAAPTATPAAATPTATAVASPASASPFAIPNFASPTGSDRKVDSILLDILQIYQQQGRQAAEQRARETNLLTKNNEVRLTLVLRTNDTKPVTDKIQAMGGRVVGVSDNLIDLVVPLDVVTSYASNNGNNFLQDLAAFETVQEVRVTPMVQPQDTLVSPDLAFSDLRAQLAAVTSEGVAKSGADKWHSAGVTGKGIKIGLVDSGFAGYESLLGQELPAKVTVKAFTYDNSLDATVHGTATAEIVHGMAPDAELYFAAFSGPATLPAALKWLTDEVGVQVISMSVGRGGETRGDGSGEWAKPVDAARAKGVLVIVAAGNDGDAHYAGVFTDTNGNGWHEFAPGKEGLRIRTSRVLDVVLRWDAWTGDKIDLNLYIFTPGGKLVASSRNAQDAGKIPVEDVYDEPQERQTFLIQVQGGPGVKAVPLELFTKNSDLEMTTARGSVASPGDAKGAFTVGAVDWQTEKLEVYSSQGPTADNRLKPEISAPTVVSSASYGRATPPRKFNGTSAATPHVSGAAALVFNVLQGANADKVQEYLISRAKDMEESGPDQKTGYGYLQLGDPGQANAPGTASTPVAPSSAPSAPLFSDTFGNPSSGLPNGGETRYDNGRYRITPNAPNRAVWATYGAPYGNATVEVTVQFEGGVPGGAGIVFWQTGNDDYYLFSISADGAYQVTRLQGGRWTSLIGWTKDAAIVANGPNTLKVETRGAAIAVSVNGKALGTAQVPAAGTGRVGLLVTTFTQPGTNAAFTNLKIAPAP